MIMMGEIRNEEQRRGDAGWSVYRSLWNDTARRRMAISPLHSGSTLRLFRSVGGVGHAVAAAAWIGACIISVPKGTEPYLKGTRRRASWSALLYGARTWPWRSSTRTRGGRYRWWAPQHLVVSRCTVVGRRWSRDRPLQGVDAALPASGTPAGCCRLITINQTQPKTLAAPSR